MCGRYTLAVPNPAELRGRFPIGESIEVRRRFNVAPGDDVLAVTTDREGAPRGELLRWGLVPAWADSPNIGLKMINARIETAAEKPAFRTALQRFRCLILADGFYEWQPRPGQSKQPFWITREDGQPFAFAGLWSKWRPRPRAGNGDAGNGDAGNGDAGKGGNGNGDAGDGSAPTLRTCTICTTAANPAIAPLHDRMPVILTPGTETAWLDSSTPIDELRGLVTGLDAAHTALHPVGSAVNDARYDGPGCLDPPAPDPQAALF